MTTELYRMKCEPEWPNTIDYVRECMVKVERMFTFGKYALIKIEGDDE